jgi:hypothetical protein
MDVEDGIIWVYGVGDDGVLAFTDFGIDESTISSISSKCIRTTSVCSTDGDADQAKRSASPLN